MNHSSPTMRRRTVLAGGAALLAFPLAGCAHSSSLLDMEEATDRELTDRVAQSVEPGTDEYTLVSDAVANGSATVSDRSPPLDADEPVAFGGAYYEVSMTELDRREATWHELQIDYNPAETTPESGAIAHEDLPSVDREALGRLVSPERPPESEGFDAGRVHDYAESATAESVFVPTQEYDILLFEGDRYRIDVSEHPVEEGRYQYELARTADSRSAFAEQLRSEYQFRLTDLSTDEQDIVEEAIDSTYLGDDSDAFQSVVSRLLAHNALEGGDTYGTWLAEYEGTSYITEAEFSADISPAR
jgi:hypothetical protein